MKKALFALGALRQPRESRPKRARSTCQVGSPRTREGSRGTTLVGRRRRPALLPDNEGDRPALLASRPLCAQVPSEFKQAARKGRPSRARGPLQPRGPSLHHATAGKPARGLSFVTAIAPKYSARRIDADACAHNFTKGARTGCVRSAEVVGPRCSKRKADRRRVMQKR